jgi:hypothetical protein
MGGDPRGAGNTARELTSWLVRQRHPFDRYDVGSVVPTGYAAYARILHPAWRSGGGRARAVRWAEVAVWSGRRLHPQAQFAALSRPLTPRADPPPWDAEPRAGTLTAVEAVALSRVLAGFTDTPDRSWFGYWDGYGWLSGAVAELDHGGGRVPPLPRAALAALRAGPRVHTTERDYLLYHGPLTAVTAFCSFPLLQTPNLWWPEDRAWCVASEIDLPCTYVGGETALVAQVLTVPDLEVVPAQLTDRIAMDSDLLNR